jgi:threonine synthase
METLWSTFWTCSTIDGSDLDNALRFGITGQLGLTSVSAYVEYEPENVHIFAPSGEPGARRAGYEAIRMICKGQARQSAPSGMAVLLHRFIVGLFAATN